MFPNSLCYSHADREGISLWSQDLQEVLQQLSYPCCLGNSSLCENCGVGAWGVYQEKLSKLCSDLQLTTCTYAEPLEGTLAPWNKSF